MYMQAGGMMVGEKVKWRLNLDAVLFHSYFSSCFLHLDIKTVFELVFRRKWWFGSKYEGFGSETGLIIAKIKMLHDPN